MAQVYDEVRERASAEAQEYSHGEERPLAGYLRVMGTYGAGVVGLGAAAFLSGRPLPERPGVGDLALVALATAKVSRLFTRDVVTSPLRAPFTRFKEGAGPAEVNEDVRGHGTKHSVGELLTCPFCMGQWVATGFAFGLVFAPKLTRQVAGTFAALEAVDFLQFGRALAEHAALASE
jgi:hypothetical protein